MLDILPPVIHRTTRSLSDFNSDDDSDSEDSTNQPILWGSDNKVYHHDALVHIMCGPTHWPVNRFIDYYLPLKKIGAGF
jgi:hypothetical protein